MTCQVASNPWPLSTAELDGVYATSTTITQGDVESSDTNLTGTTTVYVDDSDEVHVYWINQGGAGGDGPYAANYAHFKLTPPSSSCAVTPTHTTALDAVLKTPSGDVTLTTTPQQVYDCITDYFTTGSCP